MAAYWSSSGFLTFIGVAPVDFFCSRTGEFMPSDKAGECSAQTLMAKCEMLSEAPSLSKGRTSVPHAVAQSNYKWLTPPPRLPFVSVHFTKSWTLTCRGLIAIANLSQYMQYLVAKLCHLNAVMPLTDSSCQRLWRCSNIYDSSATFYKARNNWNPKHTSMSPDLIFRQHGLSVLFSAFDCQLSDVGEFWKWSHFATKILHSLEQLW